MSTVVFGYQSLPQGLMFASAGWETSPGIRWHVRMYNEAENHHVHPTPMLFNRKWTLHD